MGQRAVKKPMEKPPSPPKVAQKAHTKKRKKKRVEAWETYIYKVLKDVNWRLPPEDKGKMEESKKEKEKGKKGKGKEVDEEQEEEGEGERERGVEMSISRKAMAIMNSFVTDLFEKLAEEASMLNKSAKKETFTSWPIQKAVKVVLPYELGEFAEQMGIAAVHKFVYRTPDAPDIQLPPL